MSEIPELFMTTISPENLSKPWKSFLSHGLKIHFFNILVNRLNSFNENIGYMLYRHEDSSLIFRKKIIRDPQEKTEFKFTAKTPYDAIQILQNICVNLKKLTIPQAIKITNKDLNTGEKCFINTNFKYRDIKLKIVPNNSNNALESKKSMISLKIGPQESFKCLKHDDFFLNEELYFTEMLKSLLNASNLNTHDHLDYLISLLNHQQAFDWFKGYLSFMREAQQFTIKIPE